MTDAMSTHKPSLADRWYCPDGLLEHAAALEAALPMTMARWKTIKALNDTLAFTAAIVAMALGLDPFLAILGGALMAQGPEFVEWWLVKNDYYEFKDRQEESQESTEDE